MLYPPRPEKRPDIPDISASAGPKTDLSGTGRNRARCWPRRASFFTRFYVNRARERLSSGARGLLAPVHFVSPSR
jgi:hypothetical protein